MIYAQVDHKLFKSTSWKGMVRILKNISFDDVSNKKDYMFNVAERVQKLYDQYIEKHNYEGFVKALDKLVIITLSKCADCDHFFLDYKKDYYYCNKGIKQGFDPENCICPFMKNKLIRKMTDDILTIKSKRRVKCH